MFTHGDSKKAPRIMEKFINQCIPTVETARVLHDLESFSFPVPETQEGRHFTTCGHIDRMGEWRNSFKDWKKYRNKCIFF